MREQLETVLRELLAHPSALQPRVADHPSYESTHPALYPFFNGAGV
jgi:hypothetical protein